MAIVVTALQPYPSGWAINGTSADASGCEELVAAPATGTSLYLKKIAINVDAAIDVTIGAGETSGAVTTVIIGTIGLDANETFTYEFDRPIKLAAATSLTVDASGAGVITVVAEGYTE